MNQLEIGTLSIESSIILLIMGAASFALSILFYLRSRTMKKLPKTLRVSVFDRTFNVFNPFPEGRRLFHSYFFFLIFSPLVAFCWTFFLVFIVFMKLFEAGLMMGFVLFVLCLSLMMVSEAVEIEQNGSILTKAVRKGTALGKGDVIALHLIKKSLNKLSAYYLLLGAVFVSSFFGAPYISSALMTALAHLVGIVTTLALPTLFLAPIISALLVALATTSVFLLARRLKAAVFKFPPSGALSSAASASARVRISYEMQNQIFDFDPEELTW